MTRTLRAARASLVTTTLFALTLARVAHAETVLQLPLTGILDKRSVTTLTGGNLVVFNLPTDGGGLQNAFITNAGAAKQNAPAGHALPDDGRFPANARHPEVVLSFSNTADATAPQTHLVLPGATFTFPVPAATYSKLFLFFNGAAGGTTIDVTLTYADGMEVQHATIPDYYNDPPATDQVVFHLATDLAKWTMTNTINEANHHNIDGAEFHPAAAKTLTGVTVARGANGNLVFWGATAVATSDVGSGGSGGSGGAGGSAGANSTSGSGGSSGAVGSSGAAGATIAGASGSAAAGAIGSAGAVGGAGAPSGAGATSSAGAPSASGGALSLPSSAADDGGCSLGMKENPSSSPWSAWLVLGSAFACRWARRRRHSRG